METLKEIAILLNPWWKGGAVSKDLAKEYKRNIFNKAIKLASKKQIVILSGLRRVGKTTALYQVIEHLLDRHNSKHILYFSFDKEAGDITEILNAYQDITSVDWKKENIFVFLDEISKLEEWGRKLKLIYDAFPKIKFFISSSGSVALEEEAVSSLAGRHFLINITPLRFQEFLELRKKEKFLENTGLWEKEIEKELQSYMLRSFPEIASWKDEILIKDYLRTTLIDKIIRLDLAEKFKNVDKGLLLNLLNIFYSEPGMLLDYDSLSKKLRISKKTLFANVYYLEFSYLIRRIRNFRPSTLSASKKMQKVYANWWTLACCYTGNYDKLVENMVASSIDAKHYWREKEKEIDFLSVDGKKITLIEVKNKREVSKNELKSIKYFIRKYKAQKILIVYNGKEAEIGGIKLLPLWKWLLQNNNI